MNAATWTRTRYERALAVPAVADVHCRDDFQRIVHVQELLRFLDDVVHDDDAGSAVDDLVFGAEHTAVSRRGGQSEDERRLQQILLGRHLA